MNDRRRLLVVPLITGFMGLIAFFNMASSPRFAAIRAVDVVRLMASGMCFGVALMALILFFERPRSQTRVD
jgi:hypothetical protein